MRWLITLLAITCLAFAAPASASVAYGSINNFDCVNDTGVECHGFEIELDDIHSKDITYTYDWNHYGTPRIYEDNTDPLHPKCFIRYESGKNPDGTWKAYTAIPSGPISPTDGHQFTNPAVNFGGEHYGVGFYFSPSVIKYNWLIDDGAGNLVHGGVVNISTPVFTYYPPPAPAQPAQVQAVIVAPPPPPAPVMEFGDAVWVKVTTTQSHNNHKVELRDLVPDDPNDPNDENWQNGEPDEVEVEWQIMQTEFAKPDGGNNGELAGAPEDLNNGDEIITRKYDFFKYAGPLDPETGEVMTDSVGPDDIHGIGDYADVVVVGDYIGAQMAGFDAGGQIGLIDHVQDGEINVPYVERSMVIGGTPPIVTTRTGDLPEGMQFDAVTGVLSGTPTQAGLFSFTLHSTDAAAGDVTMTYALTVADSIVVLPHFNIGTSSAPAEGGLTSGGGDYESGSIATVVAEASPGYQFMNWTENGALVSAEASYAFMVDSNRDIVANFELIAVQTFTITTSSSPVAGGNTTGGGVYEDGALVTLNAVAADGYTFVNWTEDGAVVSPSASYAFNASANRSLVANFARITYSISVSASSAAGGSASGGGVVNSGDSVTVDAVANAGYSFANWTEGGAVVSASASYTFTASANRDLVANFTRITYAIGVSASPAAGGSVSGGGTYNSGDSVTVSAVANAGYSFANWTESGAVVSTSADFTFTSSVNRSLVANFTRITYAIGVSASPAAGGSVSGGGTVNSGDSVTVSAVANAGYTFVNWTEGGAVVSASASYTFSASANRSLVANFARITYAISVSASPAAGGSVSGGGTVNSGSSVTVSAVANAGYAFVNWTEGGVVVSTSANYTFSASANRSLVANFSPVTPTTAKLWMLGITSPTLSGCKGLGIIVLNLQAPAGGVVVNLTSSNPAVLSVPASVLLTEGNQVGTFVTSAGKVKQATNVTITATVGTSVKSGVVKVIPAK